MSWTIPNLLSLLRIVLVAPFLLALLRGEPMTALAIIVAAGVSDALDGFIARFFHQQSQLGAYLDPIADKLLLTSAYVALALPGIHPGMRVPAWITLLVLARDVLIVGGADALPGDRRAPLPAQPGQQADHRLPGRGSDPGAALRPLAAPGADLPAGALRRRRAHRRLRARLRRAHPPPARGEAAHPLTRLPKPGRWGRVGRAPACEPTPRPTRPRGVVLVTS